MKISYYTSTKEVLAELGERIQAVRIDRNTPNGL